MTPSRKHQPDRPIWPVAPDAGAPSRSGPASTARSGHQTAASGGGTSRSGTPTITEQSEGFGSFAG